MPEPDLIELFAWPLEKAGIRYLISGSVAATLYGEPRVTHDIDFVVFLRTSDVPRLGEIFPSPAFYVPPDATILQEIMRERQGHFNLVHVGSALKGDFYLAGRDELHAWAFRNAKRYPFGTSTISIAPPEYVIVRKLEFFREAGSEKHLRDIRGVLMVSGAQLDHGALNDWIVRLGLEAEWQRIPK